MSRAGGPAHHLQGNAMNRRLIALLALVLGGLATCVTLTLLARHRPAPVVGPAPAPPARVRIVEQLTQTRLHALEVEDPADLRLRDIGGVAYADEFADAFDYAAADVTVHYRPHAEHVAATLVADGLKPLFAYQLKVVGAGALCGTRESDNAGSPAAWTSWRLGRLGRWWCDDCEWNVTDADLAGHLADGHHVRGYLLFDWFVTDAEGHARHDLCVDSSLHVLWRVEQRERGPDDGPPRWYELRRDGPAWHDRGPAAERVGIFAEWEPDRPGVGEVHLPPGDYACTLTLTEESFHANMDEERAVEGGGLWAWVLEGDLRFEVAAEATRASLPAPGDGSHEGMGPSPRTEGQ